MLPVLEKGIIPVLKGAYLAALFFTETVVMLMIIPYLNRPSDVKRAVVKGVITVGFFMAILMFIIVGLLDGLIADINFPTLKLARYIKLGELVERVEPIIMLAWIGGGFIKVTVFYYCTVLAIAQWLNLRDFKSIVLPIGALVTVLSIVLWDNVVQLVYQISGVMPPYFLIIQVGIPTLLLILTSLKGKGEKHR
ncbi:MAG: hypothetical protein FH756_10515 [Firmicutes bacterium]|nr:hypothetical protein [Bacillota bacterium]